MRAIIKFFAKEHMFGNLLTLVVFIFGIYSMFSIRKEVFPKVDFDITTISTIMPGASPEQIESLIINPIEEALREVDGLKKVFSASTESQAVVIIQLDPDARDPDKTNRDIQLAIDRMEDLPEEAEEPVVKIVESGQQPIVEITVSGDIPPLELRGAAKLLADELSLLPQVARVGKNGYNKREYLIEVDPTKMAARKVSVSQVIGALKARNIAIPGGAVIDDKGREILVRTDAEYKTMLETLETSVVTNDEGFGTRIRDIATVREAEAEPRYSYRANGKHSINLVILKKEMADALVLMDSVKKRLDELRPKLPTGVNIDFARDMTVYLTTRLSVLETNVYQGLILVLIILGLFLPFRVALVVSMGIPFAMFCVFTTLYLQGYSINLLSLMGFIIVIGMLVDDAIVITENIWRHVENEGPNANVIINGTREMVIPVFASVMTTVLAFAPMMFMSGIFGKFVYQIPLVVVLALTFSLLEGYFIVPSHFASWVAPYIHRIKMPDPTKRTFFKKLVEKYGKWVSFATHHRYITLGILTLIFGFTIFLTSQTKFILFPPTGIEQFFIRVESSKDTSLAQMEEVIQPIEKIVLELPENELQDMTSTIGIHQMDGNDPLAKRGPNYAQIFVELTPLQNRDRSAQDVIEELREKVGTPKGITRVTFEMLRGGPPQGRPVSLDVKGKNFEELEKVAEALKARLAQIDGVKDIQSSRVEGKDQWTVVPKHGTTEQLGLSAQEIATTIRAAFDGIVATSVREYDEEIDIRVTLNEDKLKTKQAISNLTIGNKFGNLIPLGEVADLKLSPSINSIVHTQFKRVVNVSADLDLDKLTTRDVEKILNPELENFTKDFSEVAVVWGGESEDTQESLASLGRAFVAAVIFILFILIISFRSLLQPLLILSTIPIGFMGVQYALTVHGRPLSFMAMLGVIALAGVIVNNSIVYLEFVNTRRAAGVERFKAYVESATTRLRPIIMTTTTTLAGLLPTAYGDVISKTFKIGGADPFVIPLALSLGWGLGFGSVLNALFFPALVAIMDDMTDFFKRKRKRKISAD